MNINYKEAMDKTCVSPDFQEHTLKIIRDEAQKKSSKHNHVYRSVIKAAITCCLTFAIAIGGISVYAIAAEAKEYREALNFFEENNLSTEGLTRKDIKMVYKDITMKTYSYEKTLEILNRISVELYSTELDKMDKEKLDEIWNSRGYREYGISYYLGLHYNSCNYLQGKGDYRYKIVNTYDDSGNRYIVKYKVNGNIENEIWRYNITDIFRTNLEYITETVNGLMVFGEKEIQTEYTEYNAAAVFMLDNEGKLKWEYLYPHYDPIRLNHESFTALDYNNGEITLFGSGSRCSNGNDNYYRFIIKLDTDGDVLMNNEYDCDCRTTVSLVLKMDDRYLIKQNISNIKELTTKTELVLISETGEYINKIDYSTDGISYKIEDMIVYNGNVYISASAPKISEESFKTQLESLWNEMLNCHKDYYDKNGTYEGFKTPDEISERAKKLFITRYDAVLLVCNSELNISKAYSASDAESGLLSVSGTGKLKWGVIRTDTVVIPSTAYTSTLKYADIACTIFAYIFDKTGTFEESVEIGTFYHFY